MRRAPPPAASGPAKNTVARGTVLIDGVPFAGATQAWSLRPQAHEPHVQGCVYGDPHSVIGVAASH